MISRVNRTAWNYLYVMTACSSSTVMALSGAWSSPALAQLGDSLSTREVILIQAALPAGASLGVAAGWLCCDCWGRRPLLMAGGFISLIGWALLAYPPLGYVIAIGRTVCGFAVGLLNIASSLYIPEIATSEMRGVLFGVAQVFTNLGCLLEYGLGPFVGLAGLALASAVQPACFTFLCFYLPESPHYLVSKRRHDEAESVLLHIRRNGHDVRQELKLIEETCSQVGEGSGVRRWLETVKADWRRQVWLIGVVTGACLLKQVTGGLALLGYAQPLFLQSGLDIPSGLASLVLGAVKTLGSLFTTCLARTLSLRTLMIISCSGVALFLLGLAGYLYVHEEWGVTFVYAQWVPLVCLTMYFVFLDIGIGPFPSFLGSEMLEWRVRGGGVAVALCLSTIVSTGAVSMVVTLYLPLALSVFGLMALLAAPLLYWTLPEEGPETHSRHRHTVTKL